LQVTVKTRHLLSNEQLSHSPLMKMEDTHMTHQEFVQGYKQGLVRARIHESAAMQLMNTTAVEKRYRYAHLFWSWVWILTIPIGIVLIIWVNKWVGIGIIVLGIILPRVIKRSASEFVLEQTLADENFYNNLIESKILIVERSDQK